MRRQIIDRVRIDEPLKESSLIYSGSRMATRIN
jgi:hypothetical protein